MNRTRFLLYSAAVVLLAFLVREWFVLEAVCPDPTRGDAGAYLRYAQHLAWDGNFTMAGNGQAPIPDAFRSPGYPWLLLMLMRSRGWFEAIYQAQVLLGAATVGCVIALGRQWLPRGWALLAGVLLALQPHNIAATGTLLSEVLFGCTIAAGLLCASLALTRRSLPLALLAGAVLGYGYLVNPVLALLPLLLVPLFWRAKLLREGVALALVACLAVGGWTARNALVEAKGDQRAAINFVQGSWPEYHDAWRLQRMLMQDRYAAINAEVDAVLQDRTAGLRIVERRMAAEPVRYAEWYASKPYLLWDWDVRIGQGGIYTVLFNGSPLDHGWLMAASALQYGLNPLLFALAFAGLVLAFVRSGTEAMVAVFVVYVTAVHTVLQAEPRYAIPYRSMELLLAVSASSYLFAAYRGILKEHAAPKKMRSAWDSTTASASEGVGPSSARVVRFRQE